MRVTVVLFFIIVVLDICHSFTLYRPNKPNHHSGSDSRAVSENVDLDETDDGSFDRLRNVLSNLSPRVGLMHSRVWN